MKRVFAIDILKCPRCCGPMRIIATVHRAEATQAILACMGLPMRGPPLAPAPRDDGFDNEAVETQPADFDP